MRPELYRILFLFVFLAARNCAETCGGLGGSKTVNTDMQAGLNCVHSALCSQTAPTSAFQC